MEPVTPRRYSTCCSRPCPALIGIVLTLVWISDSEYVYISNLEVKSATSSERPRPSFVSSVPRWRDLPAPRLAASPTSHPDSLRSLLRV